MTLNIENIRIVRDHMQKLVDAGHGERIAMQHWFAVLDYDLYESVAELPKNARVIDTHSCGTSACIAGWAQFLLAKGPQRRKPAVEFAEKAFGLTVSEREYLFYGNWPNITAGNITPAEVIAELTRIIETGVVIPGDGA